MDGTERLPLARSEALATEELGDELLVYDLNEDKAHCLSPAAGRVWQLCDGATRIGAIADQLGLDASEVEQALAELDECELLTSPSGGISRRDFGFKIAKVGAATAALPMILSIAAPAAAQTQSHIAICIAIDHTAGCAACSQAAVSCCCCQAAGNVIIRCAPNLAYCQGTLGGLHCT